MAETQELLTQKIQAQGDLVRKLKAAKESSEKGKGNVNCNMKELNTHLSQYSYLSGYMPSKSDVEMSKSLNNGSYAKTYCYIKRWLDHMQSFSDTDIKQLPAAPSILKLDNTINLNEKV